MDNRQPTEGGQNVPNSTKIKAGKFDCVEVTDELKRATLTQALVGSDKEKLMIMSVSQSVCSVCEEFGKYIRFVVDINNSCLLYTSPSPRDATLSRMPSSA